MAAAWQRRRALIVAGGMTAAVLAGVAVQTLRTRSAAARIEAQAERYVALALALGRARDGEVDGYFGPPPLAAAAAAAMPVPLAQLRGEALQLLDDVRDDAPSPRGDRLTARIAQLARVIDRLRGPQPGFAEEARTLYGIDPGADDPAGRRRALAELDALLPGTGSLAARAAAYRVRYVVPEARRPALFARALAECRRRTLRHWRLPPGEGLSVEWTRDAPAAWHHYLGGFHSRLSVNPDAVAFLGTMVDVACHEGYPGHHAQFVRWEAAAGAGGLPVEDGVVLLRTPDALLREGAANYGVRLAFPLAERIAFERDVLFPLAGLPPAEAERYVRVHRLLGDLELSVVAILAGYADGSLPVEAARARLAEEALIASPDALLGFVDDLGAYAVGYTVARDRIAAQVAARSARTGRDAWGVLGDIVAGVDRSALAPVRRAPHRRRRRVSRLPRSRRRQGVRRWTAALLR